jgi:hypothetical protein
MTYDEILRDIVNRLTIETTITTGENTYNTSNREIIVSSKLKLKGKIISSSQSSTNISVY